METLFFWLSKVAWSLVAPDSLLLLAVLAAWVMLRRGALKWGRRILGALAAALLLMTLLPVGEWVLYPLEARYPTNPALPKHIAGIIVLGGAEDGARTVAWGQVTLNEASERFLGAIELALRYPEAKVLFTGGSGSMAGGNGPPGADIARALFRGQGLDPLRILYESESRNTAENASLGKALARPAPGEVWVLVTSAFHMPRAVGTFCKAGWPVVAYPVDHQTLRGRLLRLDGGITGNLGDLSVGAKEWLGLAAYYLTGRTSEPFPAGCPRQSLPVQGRATASRKPAAA